MTSDFGQGLVTAGHHQKSSSAFSSHLHRAVLLHACGCNPSFGNFWVTTLRLGGTKGLGHRLTTLVAAQSHPLPCLWAPTCFDALSMEAPWHKIALERAPFKKDFFDTLTSLINWSIWFSAFSIGIPGHYSTSNWPIIGWYWCKREPMPPKSALFKIAELWPKLHWARDFLAPYINLTFDNIMLNLETLNIFSFHFHFFLLQTIFQEPLPVLPTDEMPLSGNAQRLWVNISSACLPLPHSWLACDFLLFVFEANRYMHSWPGLV